MVRVERCNGLGWWASGMRRLCAPCGKSVSTTKTIKGPGSRVPVLPTPLRQPATYGHPVLHICSYGTILTSFGNMKLFTFTTIAVLNGLALLADAAPVNLMETKRALPTPVSVATAKTYLAACM